MAPKKVKVKPVRSGTNCQPDLPGDVQYRVLENVGEHTLMPVPVKAVRLDISTMP